MQTPHVFEPTKSKYLVITADYLVPFLISLSILLLFYLTIFSKTFKVSEVSCLIDYGECQDPSVIAEIDKLKGQNIFRLSLSAFKAKLTSGDFTIREVNVRKELPNKLFIELQSVYPVAALKVDGDHPWVVLDNQFRVIANRDTDPNVITVIVTTPHVLTVGKPVEDPLLLTTLKLALRLSDELVSVKTITLSGDNEIKILLHSGITAIFSPKLDELKQLRSLQAVLSDGTITKGVKTIDVRFAQPVLR